LLRGRDRWNDNRGVFDLENPVTEGNRLPPVAELAAQAR
jgi:hypothetical protein